MRDLRSSVHVLVVIPVDYAKSMSTSVPPIHASTQLAAATLWGAMPVSVNRATLGKTVTTKWTTAKVLLVCTTQLVWRSHRRSGVTVTSVGVVIAVNSQASGLVSSRT